MGKWITKYDKRHKEREVEDDTDIGVLWGDDMEVKKPVWLWPRMIPLAEVTGIGGEPNLGKSLLTTDIAAIVSEGATWPADDKDSVKGTILYLTGEDTPETTTLPRFIKAGGRRSRLGFVSLKPQPDEPGEYEPLFNLGPNAELLREALENAIDQGRKVRLVVIDTLADFCGKLDLNHANDTRKVIRSLKSVARKYRCAVVFVCHLNKNQEASALNRVSGSMAVVAAPRQFLLVGTDPFDEDTRMIYSLKHNLARSKGALAFTISNARGTPVIRWGKEWRDDVKPEDLIKTTNSKLEMACRWMKKYLGKGEARSIDMMRDGQKEDFSDGTLRRARQKLKDTGTIDRKRYPEGWAWFLVKQ